MVVEQSIFKTIKAQLDTAPDDPSFDAQLLTFINSALSDLHDLGAGPPDGFMITGDSESWDDLQENGPIVNRIKTWLGFKVKIAWDPPGMSHLMESLKELALEGGGRILMEKDLQRSKLTPVPEGGPLVLDGGDLG